MIINSNLKLYKLILVTINLHNKPRLKNLYIIQIPFLQANNHNNKNTFLEDFMIKNIWKEILSKTWKMVSSMDLERR